MIKAIKPNEELKIAIRELARGIFAQVGEILLRAEVLTSPTQIKKELATDCVDEVQEAVIKIVPKLANKYGVPTMCMSTNERGKDDIKPKTSQFGDN